MSWILMSDRKPVIDQKVWYYFHIPDENAGGFTILEHGTYHCDDGFDIFVSHKEDGVLVNDVTHWQPYEEDGQPLFWNERPSKPDN
jgi:hypothetical protein